MTPVTFSGCFGWLHTNDTVAAGDHAILLCPGVTRDALNAHHALRLLADDLAAAGYPCLRFDYPGTGDACEVASVAGGTGEAWTTWQQSIDWAADWLRRATGAGRLVFCGLRLGATLGTLVAARRGDVAGLVLLAPVLRGHAYMRQLSVEARLQSGEAGSGGLDFLELRLSAETVGLIGRADLRQVTLPAGRQVALFSQAASRRLDECAQAWTRSGAVVTRAGFEGLQPLLRYNMQDGPAPDFSRVITWLRHAVPAPAGSRRFPLPVPASAVLRPPGCIETPLQFGAGQRIFGMLCRPERGTDPRAVIIGNGGRDPHYGSARIGVEFARRLAAEGIASLRIDFAGLGDSPGPPGQERVLSHMFETDRRPDITAAIDVLHALGFRRFVVQGLCAGAYHAFHAAQADPRIGTLLLVNMPLFRWQTGWTIGSIYGRMSPPIHYLRRLGRKEIWRRLLRGDVDIDSIVRGQYNRLRDRVLRIVARCLGGAGPGFAAQAMTVLAKRQARTLFLFAPGDAGLDPFTQAFGPMGAALRAFDGASMEIVPGLDHDLNDRATRQTAVECMIDFLQAAVVSEDANAPGVHPDAMLS